MITQPLTPKEIGLKLIEDLRKRKEMLKTHGIRIEEEITNCDIYIREIRQALGTEEHKEEIKIKKENKNKQVKKIKTDEERLAEINKEIEEIKSRMAEKNKEVKL